MKSKYQFYEIVRIVSKKDSKSHVFGLEGAILGMAKNKEGMWGYAVYLYSKNETWDCLEDEIESTGKIDKDKSFYLGKHINIEVNPKTGEGGLKNSEI